MALQSDAGYQKANLLSAYCAHRQAGHSSRVRTRAPPPTFTFSGGRAHAVAMGTCSTTMRTMDLGQSPRNTLIGSRSIFFSFLSLSERGGGFVHTELSMSAKDPFFMTSHVVLYHGPHHRPRSVSGEWCEMRHILLLRSHSACRGMASIPTAARRTLNSLRTWWAQY